MSLTPAKYKLTIWRGTTFRKRLTLLTDGPGSAPQLLTDYTAEMVIADTPGPTGVPLETLTTENGGITIDEPNGVIEVFISSSDTEQLTWVTGYYLLTITAPAGGDTDGLIYGGITVHES